MLSHVVFLPYNVVFVNSISAFFRNIYAFHIIRIYFATKRSQRSRERMQCLRLIALPPRAGREGANRWLLTLAASLPLANLG